jgi:DNA polymerase III subunit delta
VVDAAQTPAFLTDKRVVVARGIGRFAADDLTRCSAYLGDPLDIGSRARDQQRKVPKKLSDAVKAVGSRGEHVAALATQGSPGLDLRSIAAAGLRIKPDAAAQLASWLGEDAGRLDGILATLISTYGADHGALVRGVEPFLGDAGGSAAVGLHRRHRRRRHHEGAHAARADDACGRSPPAADHGDPAQPLRERREARRDRRPLRAATRWPRPASSRRSRRRRRSRTTGAWDRQRGDGRSNCSRRPISTCGAKDLDPELVMEVLVARLSKLRTTAPADACAPTTRNCPESSLSADSGQFSESWRSAAAALTFFIRRLFLRAAAFLWMTPLAAAVSMRFTASAHSCGIVVVGADRRLARLVRVFSSLRTALLRSARLAFVRFASSGS